MNKQLALIMLLGTLLVVSGCTAPQSRPICNSPYIVKGNDCCLDKNNNNICDNDEPRCNDGLCNGNETCATCTQDCGTCDFVCNNTLIKIQKTWYDEKENDVKLTIKNERPFPLNIQPIINYTSTQSVRRLFYLSSDDKTDIKLENIEKDDFQALEAIEIKIIECNKIGDLITRNNISIFKETAELCNSHAEIKCYEGDVYWHDSCGDIEEKKGTCECGCVNGDCVVNIFTPIQIDFEPNNEIKFCGIEKNTEENIMKINLYDEGILSDFGTFSNNSFYLNPMESEKFTYTLNFPEKLDSGNYTVTFSIIRERYHEVHERIGGISKSTLKGIGRISVIVP